MLFVCFPCFPWNFLLSIGAPLLIGRGVYNLAIGGKGHVYNLAIAGKGHIYNFAIVLLLLKVWGKSKH